MQLSRPSHIHSTLGPVLYIQKHHPREFDGGGLWTALWETIVWSPAVHLNWPHRTTSLLHLSLFYQTAKICLLQHSVIPTTLKYPSKCCFPQMPILFQHNSDNKKFFPHLRQEKKNVSLEVRHASRVGRNEKNNEGEVSTESVVDISIFLHGLWWRVFQLPFQVSWVTACVHSILFRSCLTPHSLMPNVSETKQEKDVHFINQHQRF